MNLPIVAILILAIVAKPVFIFLLQQCKLARNGDWGSAIVLICVGAPVIFGYVTLRRRNAPAAHVVFNQQAESHADSRGHSHVIVSGSKSGSGYESKPQDHLSTSDQASASVGSTDPDRVAHQEQYSWSRYLVGSATVGVWIFLFYACLDGVSHKSLMRPRLFLAAAALVWLCIVLI